MITSTFLFLWNGVIEIKNSKICKKQKQNKNNMEEETEQK